MNSLELQLIHFILKAVAALCRLSAGFDSYGIPEILPWGCVPYICQLSLSHNCFLAFMSGIFGSISLGVFIWFKIMAELAWPGGSGLLLSSEDVKGGFML